jgi:branched-chain amino acid transport system ATP-binding protein
VLVVDDISVSYGGVRALRNVSLRVDKGEMVAIVGSNGAGKTTLLNTICGFNPLGSGTIAFDGSQISGLAPHRVARSGILQVPEGRHILAPLTVEENLQLGSLAARSRGKVEVEADLEGVFAFFPLLKERRNEIAGSLSGGQQQMLAIGRALMGHPRLLLLDEPSLGLAPNIVSQVFASLKRLHAEGMTVLLVEQNATRALDVSDRTYIIERGRIVREGKSHQLKNDPTIIEHYIGVLHA